MLPAIKVGITLPEWAADSGASARKHNALTKDLLRQEAQDHLQKRVPAHFKSDAASKYRYAARSASYQRWKKQRRGMTVKMTDEFGFYSYQHMSTNADLPLVRSGKTQQKIRQGATITTRGTLNRISATLKMNVPIPGAKTGRTMDIAARLRLLAAGQIRKLGDIAGAAGRIDTIKRTIDEIERIAPDEAVAISNNIAAKYADKLNRSASKRVRKR